MLSARFFYNHHFYKQYQAEIGKKNKEKAKQYPETELLLFEKHSPCSFMLSSRNNRFSKKCAKNQVCLF